MAPPLLPFTGPQSHVAFHNPTHRMDAAAVLTCGRLMLTQTALNIMEAQISSALPLSFNTGAYWEQSLTFAIQAALPLNTKYLLFYDHDSVWTPDDLWMMYRFMEANDKADAICPVQADRHGDNPLCWNWQFGTKPIDYKFDDNFMRIMHGHFGLTFIRSSVFRKMSHPWLRSQPANDGTWDRKPGKLDPDTFFWLKFHNEGHVVVQANKVVIGHMAEMIRWQTSYGVYCQTVSEFRAMGRPACARVPLPSEVEEREAAKKAVSLLEQAAKMAGVALAVPPPNQQASLLDKPDSDLHRDFPEAVPPIPTQTKVRRRQQRTPRKPKPSQQSPSSPVSQPS